MKNMSSLYSDKEDIEFYTIQNYWSRKKLKDKKVLNDKDIESLERINFYINRDLKKHKEICGKLNLKKEYDIFHTESEIKELKLRDNLLEYIIDTLKKDINSNIDEDVERYREMQKELMWEEYWEED